MEAFVRVVESGSFSAAARLLEVGQPAVSKTIAQLEERLGVALLIRSTHGLTPTEAGQDFYAHAKLSIEEADEADLAARGAASNLAGRLRICAAVTFARLHVVPRLAAFLASHPDLDIEVILDDRNVDLIEGGIDVALRMGDLADSTLTARKIGRSPRMVVGTPAYFEKHGEPTSPAELADHQAIVYSIRGGGSTWVFRNGSEEIPAALKGRVRVNAAEGVREAVFADLGLSVSSEWMFAPELASGKVRSVLPQWQLPPVDLWAVFPTGRKANAKARAFAEFIEAELAGTVSDTEAEKRTESSK